MNHRTGRDTTPGSTTAEPRPPRRHKPAYWFVALAVFGLALAAWTIARWLAAGGPHQFGTGPDPEPAHVKVAIRTYESLYVIVLVYSLRLAVQTSRRAGRLSFPAILFLAAPTPFWMDPVFNYLRPGYFNNSYTFHVRSWGNEIPGWQNPANGQPFPLALIIGYSAATPVLAFMIRGIMRWLKRYRPQTSTFSLILFAVLTAGLIELAIEGTAIRFQITAYPSAIHALSLWGGEPFQVPLYLVLIGDLWWLPAGLLYYYVGKDGLSPVERGIPDSASPRLKSLLRWLAVTGFLQGTFAIYMALHVLFIQFGDPIPHYPSYMLYR
ncbi:spirocyclase AveC family protein [Streptomyces sp. BHT-5-2]|uniref:spirocyclase AveC family protein n=1 Tax=Streptomyces sp. BHT-5-2 TaxID=2866715 RepID=UPI001C8D38E4|nr:spirocyclase AveC family protein [Streptomyces sp. BHT-5-2]QZL04427.1 spirocyclase AveC family protein [Streptomyces sp. BHT-5-2]